MDNQQRHQKLKAERTPKGPESKSNQAEAEHKPTETEAEQRHKAGLDSDPGISDKDRDAMHKEEMAATTIQAAFRAYKTRESIVADREAGPSRLPEGESELRKDDNDETHIPRSKSRPGVSFLEKIRKYFVSYFSSTKKELKKKNSDEEYEVLRVMYLILVTGGYRLDDEKDSSYGKVMFSYDLDKNKWEKFGTMEIARHHHCLVPLNNDHYFIGGCDPRKTKIGRMFPDKRCFKFEWKRREWTEISNMIHSRMYHGAAEIGGHIYAIGGIDDKDRMLSSVEVFDPESNSWVVSHLHLQMPTQGIGVCSHQDKIWAVGGMTVNADGKIRLLNSVRSLDLQNNSWDRSHGQLPSPRAFITLVSFYTDLYAIGGISQSEEDEDELTSVSDVLYYDMQEQRWVSTTSLPFPRHSVKASVLRKKLFVLGGLSTFQRTIVNQFLMFEKETKKWFTCPSLPEPLDGFAVDTVRLEIAYTQK